MRVVFNPSGPRLQGVNMAERDFSVTLTRAVDDLSGTTAPFTISEESGNVVTVSGVASRYILSSAQDLKLPPVTFESLDPAVFTVSGGQAWKVGPGIGRLRATGYAGRREYPLDFQDAAEVKTYEHLSFTAGSLAEHVTNKVLARLVGKARGPAHQNLYVDGGTFGRNAAECATAGFNPNSIVAGLDLNCVAFAWENTLFPTASQHRFPPMLVGPRHFVAAWHCIPREGQLVVWRLPNGTFFEAVVAKAAQLPADVGYGMLDRDVPGITPAMILPTNYEQKLKAGQSFVEDGKRVFRSGGMLCMALTANTSLDLGYTRHAQVFGVGDLVANAALRSAYLTFGAPFQAAAKPFYSTPYGGDSGSPIFFVISQGGVDTPVFMGHFATAVSAGHISAYSTQIATAFNDWGPNLLSYSTPFSFRFADLSAFPDVA